LKGGSPGDSKVQQCPHPRLTSMGNDLGLIHCTDIHRVSSTFQVTYVVRDDGAGYDFEF